MRADVLVLLLRERDGRERSRQRGDSIAASPNAAPKPDNTFSSPTRKAFAFRIHLIKVHIALRVLHNILAVGSSSSLTAQLHLQYNRNWENDQLTRMPHHVDNDFSAPAESHDFSALLFDMDGTIIDSTPAIVKYWKQLGKEIGVDGDYILETSHGRRSVDVLAIHAPHLANMEYVSKTEGRIPLEYGQDAVEIPGSRMLLDSLEKVGAPWAIVTSGTRPLVTGWLNVMKLAFPKYMVTAEEVEKGKPDPACYRLGAKRLGKAEVDPQKILVLEDAPAGVKAGKAAGYKVVALATTHSIEQLRDAGADWIVQDMRSVTMRDLDSKMGTVQVEIRDALMA